MARPRRTFAQRLEKALDRRILEGLEKGVVVEDENGFPKLDPDGKIVRRSPSAAFLAEARKRLGEVQRRDPNDAHEFLEKAFKLRGHELPPLEGDDANPTDAGDGATDPATSA